MVLPSSVTKNRPGLSYFVLKCLCTEVYYLNVAFSSENEKYFNVLYF